MLRNLMASAVTALVVGPWAMPVHAAQVDDLLEALGVPQIVGIMREEGLDYGETLAEDMQKDPKSLMRMLSAKGNPRADNLFAMVARLKQREGVSFSLAPNAELHA